MPSVASFNPVGILHNTYWTLHWMGLGVSLDAWQHAATTPNLDNEINL